MSQSGSSLHGAKPERIFAIFDSIEFLTSSSRAKSFRPEIAKRFPDYLKTL